MSINYQFSVAPMMGYTTPHARYFYRLLSKKTLLFTEMIASQALIRFDDNKIFQENFNENPLILQVGGSDEYELIKCCHIAEKLKYDGINLNVGCPSKKVQKGKFGACLMKDPEKVSKIIKSMINESKIEVSIKCRTGVDNYDSYEFFKKFISKTTDAGCKTFFIHARKALLKGLNPHQNRTIPKLEYEKVYKLKNDFPDNNIILNGGINNLNDYDKVIENLDGIMIGRLIQKNPFILSNIDNKIFKVKKQQINKIDIIRNYFKYMRNHIGEKSIYSLISPLLSIYFGIPNSKVWKQKINKLIQYRNFDNLENICINSIL